MTTPARSNASPEQVRLRRRAQMPAVAISDFTRKRVVLTGLSVHFITAVGLCAWIMHPCSSFRLSNVEVMTISCVTDDLLAMSIISGNFGFVRLIASTHASFVVVVVVVDDVRADAASPAIEIIAGATEVSVIWIIWKVPLEGGETRADQPGPTVRVGRGRERISTISGTQLSNVLRSSPACTSTARFNDGTMNNRRPPNPPLAAQSISRHARRIG